MQAIITALTSQEIITTLKNHLPDYSYLNDDELKEVVKSASVPETVKAHLVDSADPLGARVKATLGHEEVQLAIRRALAKAGHLMEEVLAQLLQNPEVMTSIREKMVNTGFPKDADMAIHYSNLRFAVYTLSVATIGGMFAVALSNDYSQALENQTIQKWYGGSAFLLVLCFAVMQFRISMSIGHFQDKAYGTSISRQRHQRAWKFIALVNTLAPYGLALIIWGHYWCYGGFVEKERESDAKSEQRTELTLPADATTLSKSERNTAQK